MLQSNLYGRAKEICCKIPDGTIRSADGKAAIVNALYKRDALSTVSNVYQDFNAVLTTRRGERETFKNFESRFEAKVAKFKSHGSSCNLPEALLAFMLLGNACVDNTQRISVLAAAVPTAAGEEAASPMTTAQYLEKISYDSVAAVLRQCESTGNNNKNPLSASSSFAGKRSNNRRPLSREQLADLKSKSICHKCNKMGHWRSDHNKDGSLKPGVKSVDPNSGSSSAQ